ncbi:hypothetical protein Hsw_2151 [Hymenobacter swuensis DY53]|uniref:Uncharacterized protein n=1 Tax=Hymenobacter swuensis DY53 TaxID=1227739 RepID=W8F553_9BACT|nr:hypothetical protein Hsw_2151 [Hymenobacter swuensis DY53]
MGSTQAELDIATVPLSTGLYYIHLTGARSSPIQYKLLH